MGQSSIVTDMHCNNELSCCLWIHMYVPNSSLQFLLWSTSWSILTLTQLYLGSLLCVFHPCMESNSTNICGCLKLSHSIRVLFNHVFRFDLSTVLPKMCSKSFLTFLRRPKQPVCTVHLVHYKSLVDSTIHGTKKQIQILFLRMVAELIKMDPAR